MSTISSSDKNVSFLFSFINMFWWLTYVYSTGSIVDFKNGQQVWCHLRERSGTRTRPLLRQSYGHGVKSSEERPDEEPSLLPYTARRLCSKVAEWSTVKWPLWFQRRFYFHQCGIDWGMEKNIICCTKMRIKY